MYYQYCKMCLSQILVLLCTCFAMATKIAANCKPPSPIDLFHSLQIIHCLCDNNVEFHRPLDLHPQSHIIWDANCSRLNVISSKFSNCLKNAVMILFTTLSLLLSSFIACDTSNLVLLLGTDC